MAHSCELANREIKKLPSLLAIEKRMINMKELERILKALANKRRLAILQFLKKNTEASVTELAGAIHLSFKSTSRHLSVLSVVDILEKEQRSIQMYYRLNSRRNGTLEHILSLL